MKPQTALNRAGDEELYRLSFVVQNRHQRARVRNSRIISDIL